MEVESSAMLSRISSLASAERLPDMGRLIGDWAWRHCSHAVSAGVSGRQRAVFYRPRHPWCGWSPPERPRWPALGIEHGQPGPRPPSDGRHANQCNSVQTAFRLHKVAYNFMEFDGRIGVVVPQRGLARLRLGAKRRGTRGAGAGRHALPCRPGPRRSVNLYPLRGGNPAARRIRSTTSISWRPVSGSRVALAILASSCASSTTLSLSVMAVPPSRTALSLYTRA